jgi:hypothetical protein
MMPRMLQTATSAEHPMPPNERLDVLFEQLAELAGQRNAIDGRIVDIAAEIDRDELWGGTGARSIAALLAWKLGISPGNAKTIATVAHRASEFPRCLKGLRKGRLSLDQVGVIAERASEGSDKHYAALARWATVNQLRKAISLEPRSDPDPDPDPDLDPDFGVHADTDLQPGGDPCRDSTGDPGGNTDPDTNTDGSADPDGNPDRGGHPDRGADPQPGTDPDRCGNTPAPAGPDSHTYPDSDIDALGDPSRPQPQVTITKSADADFTYWRIKLSPMEAAKLEAAVQSHLDALIAEWRRDHENSATTDQRHPIPTIGDAFMRLIETGWDTEAARRPHGQHTTVVVHLDIKEKVAGLHLGPLLTDSERQYLTCDATCETWFERNGEPIGAGRTTRTISRTLRRALEHRDHNCVVPGCGATRGLHAHHIEHWENGGPTDLNNLVLLCPYHHRLHHRGVITITGPADQLTITDRNGRLLRPGSVARPPTTPPPPVPPCPGPTGERADWWWYQPFQPKRPPTNN